MAGFLRVVDYIRPDRIVGILFACFFLIAFAPLKAIPPSLMLARSLAAVLVGLAGWLFFWGITRGPQAFALGTERQKSFLREWLLQSSLGLLLMGSWAVGQWPGFCSADTFANLLSLTKYEFFEWSSSLYSLFLLTLKQISAHLGFVSVVQVAGVSLTSGLFFSLPRLRGDRLWFWRILLLLFLLDPVNGGMTIFLVRDTLFSWCHLVCALFFPWYRIFFREKSSPPLILLSVYSLLLVCTSKLRMETTYALFLVPFLLRWVCGWQMKAVGLFCSISLLFSSLIFLAMPTWTKTPPLNPSYALTAFFNPLSEMIHHPYKTENRAADNRLVNKYLNYSLLGKLRDPTGITAFHGGALRGELNDGDVGVLRSFFLKMVWRNPGIFLKNRWSMLWAMNGMSRSTCYFSDGLEAMDEFAVWSKVSLGIKKAPLSLWLYDRQKQLLEYSVFERRQLLSKIAASNLIPLIFLGLSLLLFYWAPGTASAGLILSIRLFIVFFTSPAGYFRYVYGIYLFGFFAPVFIWLELRGERKPEFEMPPRLSSKSLHSSAVLATHLIKGVANLT